MPHCSLSKIKLESNTRNAIALAVERMTILSERDRVLLDCLERDSLESLRPLARRSSLKGSWKDPVSEVEVNVKHLATRLENKMKLTPKMDRRTIEDSMGRAILN